MLKKILFRADGNSTTGLGHLYRLFALVEIYKDQFDFVFLTKESSVLTVIPEDYLLKTIPENIDLEDEPQWVKSYFPSDEYIVISDGYQFTSSYHKKLKEFGYFLMYVDDLAIEHMFADIVVNHAPNAKKSIYNKEPYTTFALGTDYAILRPKFLASAKKERLTSKIDTVFVCYGGADPFDFTLQTVKSLLEVEKIKKINVVVGGAYKHQKINQVEAQHNNILEIHKNLNENELNMLMESSNISFVSSSTILYEVMTVKMPIFTGYFVQNQIDFYNGIQEKEVFFPMGDLRNFNFNKIPEKLELLTEDKIKNQIKAQKSIIDGNQKERFISLLNDFKS